MYIYYVFISKNRVTPDVNISHNRLIISNNYIKWINDYGGPDLKESFKLGLNKLFFECS